MGHRFGWVAAAVVAVVALAVGAVGYNIGVSHGLAMAVPAAGAPSVAVPYMWYRPWGFGFGFGPLFFLLLFFFVFRPLVWGGLYGRRWHHAYPGDVPPRFEEWHRRAHEQMNSQSLQGPSQSQQSRA
jgi:hypothetical protein